MSNIPASDPPTRTFGPVLIAIGLLVLWLSGGISNSTVGHNDDPGPRTFPIATASILLAGGLFELVRYLRQPKSGKPPERSAAGSPGQTASPPNNRQAIFLIAGLAIYLIAMPWAGFPTATWIFSLVLMLRLGAGKLMATTASAGLVLAIYLLFVLLFKVQLPPGVLGLSW
jgi:hypothetical protein